MRVRQLLRQFVAGRIAETVVILQAEEGGFDSRFGLFAPATNNMLGERRADSCPVLHMPEHGDDVKLKKGAHVEIIVATKNA